MKKLADVQGIASTKVKYFALGAGNGGVACSLLDTAFVRGQWLIFQNLQLVPNIIVALQRRIDEAKDIHEDFRLWFTWEHTSLPQLQLLQRSIVIHCQPIRAIRYHTNTFVYSINESVFEESSAKRHVMGCLVHLHRRWEWSADYAPFYWHAAFRMHSTNILSDMSHYAHSFSPSATEATGEQIHDRLTKFLASIYSHFITVCYHCYFDNQSSIAYILCFRMGARNPRISELKVCGIHEFSRESIIDVGAQIPNALSEFGLMTQI